MTRHDPAHEEVLRDLAVGDLADDAPAARRLLESCAECRERLAELRGIAARLDEAGEVERQVRAEAERSTGSATEEARVAEILRAAAAGTRPATRDAGGAARPATRRAAIAAVFLIGAAGLIALALRSFTGREAEPSDPIMGASRIEAIAPQGLVSDFTTFEWRGERPPQGWFEVRVFRAGAPPGEPPLAESGPIEETSWTPGTGVTQLMPREIEWEVRVFDAEGSSPARHGTDRGGPSRALIPRARAAQLVVAALAAVLLAAPPLLAASARSPQEAPTAPPADDLKALYDEVMALIEADRRDEIRDRVELARALYPGLKDGNPAAWAAYKGAGHLAEKSDDPLEKERYFRIAFDASSRLANARARSRSLVLLSSTLIGLGRLDEARDFVDAQLAAIPADDEYVAKLALPVAEREISERRYAEAVRHLAAAEASSPTPDELARVHGSRGQIALDLGRIEVAAAELAREEDLLAQDGMPPKPLALAISYLHRANLRLATDRSALLDRLVAEALARPELAREVPSLPSALRLRSAIGRMAEERLGNRTEPGAAAILREVLDDPRAGAAERVGARLRLAHLATNAGDAPAAAAELALLPERLGALDEAYRAALSARIARIARITMGGGAEHAASAVAELERAWERLVGSWSDEEGGPEGSGFLHYEQVRLLLSERIETALAAAGAAPEAGAEVSAEAGPRAALEIAFRAGELGSLHRALAAPAASLEAVRAELIPPAGGIALFLPAADRSHLFLVDRERVSHHFLPPRDAIERARRALAELRQEVPATASATVERRARFAAVSRRLAEQLLPAAAEEQVAGWNTLTVVGLDLLGTLPLPELVLADGTALGDRVAIGALPSLSVGLALARRAEERERARPPRSGAVLIAAPLLSEATRARFPDAEPLPLDDKTARARVAAHTRCTVRIGAVATLAALRGALGGDPAVVQILCHGVRDPERLGRVSLLLAGETDAVVPAEVLATLRAPPLAIVTACASGEGPLRLGDPGSVDFMGALLRAGADAVIVSTGDLAWSATLARSQALHEAIAAGSTPAKALRKARLAEMAAGGSLDPAHRSPLVVFGLAHRPTVRREE